MRKLTSIALFLLLPVVFFLAGVYISPEAQETPLCIPPPEPVYSNSDFIFSDVNRYRTSSKKNALIERDDLCALASLRAYQSVSDWSHDQFYPLAKLYPQWNFMVENLVMETPDHMVVREWIGSPTHKENLDAKITHGCVECYKNNCAFIGAL
jgi:hypothetical protein